MCLGLRKICIFYLLQALELCNLGCTELLNVCVANNWCLIFRNVIFRCLATGEEAKYNYLLGYLAFAISILNVQFPDKRHVYLWKLFTRPELYILQNSRGNQSQIQRCANIFLRKTTLSYDRAQSALYFTRIL